MGRTAAIDAVLSRAVADGEVPGVVAVAADRNGVIYEGAFGERALGSGAAMTIDTVFWIASMTKAVTAAAAMQLVEQEQLRLDSPAAEVLPELGKKQVFTGFDPDGQPRFRDPVRPVTLRHLLTHTAGFGYAVWHPDLVRYMQMPSPAGVSPAVHSTFGGPLLFDPGDQWLYSTSIDWAGRMVEAVSGMRLGAYMQQHLFAPLGITDTSFLPTAAQQQRRASRHTREADGTLTAQPNSPAVAPEFDAGGGGLSGTAHDYLRFARMILGDGKLDGVQVLRPATVTEMSRNHAGALACGVLETVNPQVSNTADFFPGQRGEWGLSFLINPQPSPHGRAAGSLAWAGLANTYYWIDPAAGITGVLLTQILPFFDHNAVDLLHAFERAVYGVEG